MTWFFRSQEAERLKVSQGLYDIDLVPVFLARNLDIHLGTDEWHDMLAHARIAVRSRAVSSTSANSAESAEHVVDDEGAAQRQRISQLESQLAALQKVACLRWEHVLSLVFKSSLARHGSTR